MSNTCITEYFYCTADCSDVRLGGDFGEILSPNYPSVYPHDLNCKWTIEVKEGFDVLFVIDAMDIELAVECIYDYLYITTADGQELK